MLSSKVSGPSLGGRFSNQGAAVARPLGMSRATISDLENGTIKELGGRKLACLCQRLGLDLYISEHRRPMLHEPYAENRRQREEAIRELERRPAQPLGRGPNSSVNSQDVSASMNTEYRE